MKTDITMAGLEIGCRVDMAHGRHGIVRNIHPNPDSNPYYMDVEVVSLGRVAHYNQIDVSRDFDDAQTARRARLVQLNKAFNDALDTGWPAEDENVQRFVCLTLYRETEGQIHWGDTFNQCVDLVGGEVLDGWVPQGVFDLDTGDKIEVHISSPILTPSEDQHMTVNELDVKEMETQAAFTEEHYDLIGYELNISITVSPDAHDPVLADTKNLQHWHGVEHFQIRTREIRQYNTKED